MKNKFKTFEELQEYIKKQKETDDSKREIPSCPATKT